MYKCWSYRSQWKDWRQGEERFSDAPKSVENNKDFRKKKKEERKNFKNRAYVFNYLHKLKKAVAEFYDPKKTFNALFKRCHSS